MYLFKGTTIRGKGVTWGDTVTIELLLFWEFFSLGDRLALGILSIFGCAESAGALLVHFGTRGHTYKKKCISCQRGDTHIRSMFFLFHKQTLPSNVSHPKRHLSSPSHNQRKHIMNKINPFFQNIPSTAMKKTFCGLIFKNK